MQVSTWIERWSAYGRGATRAFYGRSDPHTLSYRKINGREFTRHFYTDEEMQDFISRWRSGWVWFECSVDNVLVSTH